MESAKAQLTDKLKTATNVLVTVSRNPSVDQLAACIGLTLVLNKLNKHAAAVFSGQVPSTLEFLKPEETLEKNTDSLRDFIIALDKSKADKLRYKVEDNVVRIFITPYRTSISQADLEFSEGDFNVDVVIALGVQSQEDLDEAITAHGRILHDATVASINIALNGDLGSINWYDAQASSLSELVADLAQTLDAKILDNQIATALLTGIVAETDRFSNDKTSSQTMNVSAALMAAGANQQLVASKLKGTVVASPDAPGSQPAGTDEDNGILEIDHDASSASPALSPPPPATPPPAETPSPASAPANNLSPGARMITEPPSMGGTLSANTSEEGLDPATDPLSMPTEEMPQLLNRKPGSAGPASKSSPLTPMPPTFMPPATPLDPVIANNLPSDIDNRTLTELEKAVDSPHTKTESLDEARKEVKQALNDPAAAMQPEPTQVLNAQPLGDDLHPDSSAQNGGSGAPPPVPPPIPFQFGDSPSPPQNPPQ